MEKDFLWGENVIEKDNFFQKKIERIPVRQP